MKTSRVCWQMFYAFFLAILFSSCGSKSTPPPPFGVVPTEHQLAWQDLEYYMFIHFGPNTFTDVEWGDGKENPEVFNPTNVDTRQWASVAKDAGMKGIILTAKHHDGFCLWPSKYSTHTVRESAWKNGEGDLLKELSESCKEYGLKFGIYLSPWDQNHPDYGTPAYNQTFANTLTEVLTNYGEIFEQWFDGATDGTSKQIYDWDMFHKVVYDNQPQAIIFSDVGPGCRWIGNESGIAGETNWSRMNTKGFEPGLKAPKPEVLNTGQAYGEAWVPGEVDVSIRPGWFYSPSTDEKVKSVEQLMDIYYTSVGRNGNLLLNVPPDRTGRIHPTDSTRLMEFREAREKEFAKNLATNLVSFELRDKEADFPAHNMLDVNKQTYWVGDDDAKSASIEFVFPEPTEFNRILLQEYIALGQRVACFNVEAWDESESKWTEIVNATTIGYKRILKFPNVTTSKFRVNITDALATPILNNLEIYNAPIDNKSRIVDGKPIAMPDGRIRHIEKINNDIVVSLGKEYSVKGFTFMPDSSNDYAGIQRYNFYVSDDLQGWTMVLSNVIFNNIKNNPIEQIVNLEKPVKASYIRILPTQLTDKNADAYSFFSLEAITE